MAIAAARLRGEERNHCGARASAFVASRYSAHSACLESWKLTCIRSQPSASVFFGEDGQRSAYQVLPPRRVHPHQHGDLVAAGPKLRAAFLPGPVQIT